MRFAKAVVAANVHVAGMRAMGAGQLQDDGDEDGGADAPERTPPGGTAHGSFPKTPMGSGKSYAGWRGAAASRAVGFLKQRVSRAGRARVGPRACGGPDCTHACNDEAAGAAWIPGDEADDPQPCGFLPMWRTWQGLRRGWRPFRIPRGGQWKGWPAFGKGWEPRHKGGKPFDKGWQGFDKGLKPRA